MAFEGLSAKGAVTGMQRADTLRSNLETAEVGRQTQADELQMKKNEEAAKNLQSAQDSILKMIETAKTNDMPSEDIQKLISGPVNQYLSFSKSNQERGAQVPDTGSFQNLLNSALMGRTGAEQLKQEMIKKRAMALAKKRGEEEGETPSHTAVKIGEPGSQLTVKIDPVSGMWVDLQDSPINENLYNVVGMAKASGKSSGESADALAPTKAIQTELGKKLIATNDSIANLESISDSYEKEFLQLPAKAELWILSTKESLGFDLTPDQEKTVDKISVFKRRSIAAVNTVIKEITGAQMSELEAKRIRKQVPDPEKDSPSEYTAKLKDVLKHTKLARARYKYMLANGFEHDFSGDSEPSISIDEMESVIDGRVTELRKLGMRPVDIRAKIKEEFEI